MQAMEKTHQGLVGVASWSWMEIDPFIVKTSTRVS